jgi:predicted dehydrogenase
MTTPPFTPVVLGLGRAGRELHWPALSNLAAQVPELVDMTAATAVDIAGIADPSFAPRVATVLPHAEEIGGTPVLHLCLPVEARSEAVAEAIAKGYRRLLIEKPLADNEKVARAIVAAAADGGAALRVVSLWPHSWAVGEIARRVADLRHGCLVDLRIVQNKPRFELSARRHGENILHVEMPHQIALALAIAGADIGLLDARCRSLALPDGDLPNMGGCLIRLAHEQGAISTLSSELDHPARERWMRARFADGTTLTAYLPVSRDDLFAQFVHHDPSGRMVERKRGRDDVFAVCLNAAYEGFAQAKEAPAEDYTSPDQHLRIARIIDAARARMEASPSLPASIDLLPTTK